MIPVEIGVPSHRVEYFDEAKNTSLVALNLDLVAEKRARAELRTAIYQHRISGIYEKKGTPLILQERRFDLEKSNSEH